MSKFKADFSDEELIDILQQQITGPNADLLTEAVLGLLDDTEWRKTILLKAALGTKARSKFRLHEKYLVKVSDLSLYHADKVLMKEKGLINGDNQLECVLKAFNPFTHSKYKVSYQYLNSNGEQKTETYDLHESYLKVAEEFPEEDDDLPF
jgi:hypothetical protein